MSEAKAAHSVAINALAADGGAASTLGAAFRRIRHLLEGRDLSGGIDRHERDILEVARASLTLLDELEEGRSGIWAARQLRDLLEKQLVAGCMGDIAAARNRGPGVRSILLGGGFLFAMILAVMLALDVSNAEADKREVQELHPVQLPTVVEEAGR